MHDALADSPNLTLCALYISYIITRRSPYLFCTKLHASDIQNNYEHLLISKRKKWKTAYSTYKGLGNSCRWNMKTRETNTECNRNAWAYTARYAVACAGFRWR